MKKIFFLVVVIATVGCFSKKGNPTTKTVTDSVSTVVITPEMARFAEGKVLYEQNCKGCHRLFRPSEISEEQWQINVPIMTRKVNKNEPTISPAQQELILNYVITAKRNSPAE